MITLLLVSAAFACEPPSHVVVSTKPDGTTIAIAGPRGCAWDLPKDAPRVVAGTSTLLFDLSSPHGVADTAFLVPGAVPASSPIAQAWFRDELAQNMPVYVDGVRMMRTGMMY
ncbi:hypothetical protein LBMAG42_08220 [Deltaproteobacteria bacterium]|nr:hypothetical protein LBMAG42_08220 [Deltaproteobacteria bacterium]